MSDKPVLPLPTEFFDGEIVVASTWLNDDEPEGATAALLTLTNEPGNHYRVRQIQVRFEQWTTTDWDAFPNIVPAVRAYEEGGGDY